MDSLCRVEPHRFEGRELFMLSAGCPEDIPGTLGLPSPYFVCLIAWDATGASDEAVRSVAEKLVGAGCVYACCWGPDCERVHDMIDRIDVERDPGADRVVMTTWHGRDSLARALWFFLNLTQPDPAYEAGCGCSVAISIGSEQWAAQIQSALTSPGTLDGGFPISDDEPD
jgi:hypothetical protein